MAAKNHPLKYQNAITHKTPPDINYPKASNRAQRSKLKASNLFPPSLKKKRLNMMAWCWESGSVWVQWHKKTAIPKRMAEMVFLTVDIANG